MYIDVNKLHIMYNVIINGIKGDFKMSKSVVVYKSNYGSTKIYAKWIAKELDADIYEAKEVKIDKLKEYDNIILGGGLYAGGILGSSIISKNFESIRDKKIIVFTVGLAPIKDKEIFKPIIEKNFTLEMRQSISFFHLRGGVDYKKLSIIHKAMMAMLKFTLSRKKPEELTEDDKLMLKTYGDKVDFIDVNTAREIVSYVQKI